MTCLLSVASSSLAQTPAEAPPAAGKPAPAPQAAGEPTTEPTSEASETATPSEASEPAVDPYLEAKERVARAEQLYAEGNYDAALTEFGQAYDTMTGHPARNYVLFNVGKCQEKLYRYDAAIRSYRTYLENSGDGAEDKGAVEAKIELLEGLLGTLRVKVTAKKGIAPSSYEIWVDGRLIDGSPESFMIPGGNHQVELRAEGFEVANQEVQVPARSEKSLTFELTPLAKEYRGLKSTYFWTAAGLAGAAGIVGGTFGVLTVSKKSELKQGAPETITQEDADGLRNGALVADIFFAGAGVCATTAVILAFMTDWSGESPEKGPVTVKEVGIAPTPGGGYLGIRGAF
jgi:tetratricopeptide (TPR) repeat protein